MVVCICSDNFSLHSNNNTGNTIRVRFDEAMICYKFNSPSLGAPFRNTSTVRVNGEKIFNYQYYKKNYFFVSVTFWRAKKTYTDSISRIVLFTLFEFLIFFSFLPYNRNKVSRLRLYRNFYTRKFSHFLTRINRCGDTDRSMSETNRKKDKKVIEITSQNEIGPFSWKKIPYSLSKIKLADDMPPRQHIQLMSRNSCVIGFRRKNYQMASGIRMQLE